MGHNTETRWSGRWDCRRGSLNLCKTTLLLVRCGSNLTKNLLKFVPLFHTCSCLNKYFQHFKFCSFKVSLVNYLIKTFYYTFFDQMAGKISCPVEYNVQWNKNCKINYLPSLMSSIKASPAFFWIEFCHS